MPRTEALRMARQKDALSLPKKRGETVNTRTHTSRKYTTEKKNLEAGTDIEGMRSTAYR